MTIHGFFHVVTVTLTDPPRCAVCFDLAYASGVMDATVACGDCALEMDAECTQCV